MLTAKSDAILAESDLSRELLFVGKNQKIVDLSGYFKEYSRFGCLSHFFRLSNQWIIFEFKQNGAS